MDKKEKIRNIIVFGMVVSTLAGRTIWKKEYRLIMREKARNIRRAVCR